MNLILFGGLFSITIFIFSLSRTVGRPVHLSCFRCVHNVVDEWLFWGKNTVAVNRPTFVTFTLSRYTRNYCTYFSKMPAYERPDTIDDRNDRERSYTSRSRSIHTVVGDFDSNLACRLMIFYPVH